MPKAKATKSPKSVKANQASADLVKHYPLIIIALSLVIVVLALGR